MAAGPPNSCYMNRDAVMIHDTWQVSGLRGTGSYHFEAHKVFVPDSHTHDSAAPRSYQGGLIYRLPVVSMFAWTVSVVPLGVARGAIDAFVELAASRRRQGMSIALRDRETVQAAVGRAEAMHRAARAFLIDAMTELMDMSESGGEPPLRTRAMFRSACANAAETAMRIVHLLAREAGAVSIFESCPLERAVRDINAAGHHIAMSQNNYAVLGRLALGLEPGVARV
jgi:alkylation response protein AidB-like acyl-CoA dehydrogenase